MLLGNLNLQYPLFYLQPLNLSFEKPQINLIIPPNIRYEYDNIYKQKKKPIICRPTRTHVLPPFGHLGLCNTKTKGKEYATFGTNIGHGQ